MVYPVPSFCGGDVLKTTDRGLSWSSLGFTDPVTAMAIDPADSTILYVSSYHHSLLGDSSSASKSTDGGSSWMRLDDGFPSGFVSQWLIDPSPPETVYVATCDSGVFASADGGLTWEARNRGLSNTCVRSLVRDPVNSGTLYAGTTTFDQTAPGVFRSTDRGMTWVATVFSRGAVALAIDPSNPVTLFAGTVEEGIFRSTDSGATWSSLNDGLGSLGIDALVIDSAGEYLHAATEAGVFDLRLRHLARVVGTR